MTITLMSRVGEDVSGTMEKMIEDDPLVSFTRESITGCTNCTLHENVVSPVPFYPSITAADVAIIGEAPGEAEDRENQPFIGSSGQLLRRVLSNIGAGNYSMMNVICCRPPANRTPYGHEIHACRDNFHLQLTTTDPKVMLLLGATSLAQWRPDLQISKARGRIGKWGERWVVTAFHPSYILRNKGLYGEFVEDVRLAFTLLHKKNKMGLLKETCVQCPNDVYYYDRDLVAWCKGCWHPSLGVRETYTQGSLL